MDSFPLNVCMYNFILIEKEKKECSFVLNLSGCCATGLVERTGGRRRRDDGEEEVMAV